MKFLVENWELLVAAIAVIAVAALAVYTFIKKPRSEQIAKIQEWLLWAVTQAEKNLGGGTGQLKLRYVYDLFVDRFPDAVQLLSFERFSFMVDQALIKMKHLLETNIKIETYVIEGNEKQI